MNDAELAQASAERATQAEEFAVHAVHPLIDELSTFAQIWWDCPGESRTEAAAMEDLREIIEGTSDKRALEHQVELIAEVRLQHVVSMFIEGKL